MKNFKNVDEKYKYYIEQKKAKLIAQGTYGCVYKPSLKCVNDNMENNEYLGKVSKLMTLENAEDELTEIKKISKIDPEFKYHLRPPSICSTDIKTMLKSKNISKCSLQKARFENFYKKNNKYNEPTLLLMENGGVDLSMMLKNSTKPIYFE